MPCHGEDVSATESLAVDLDGSEQAPRADVAPWADGVRCDSDGETGHVERCKMRQPLELQAINYIDY